MTEGRHEPDEQRHPLLGHCRDLGVRAYPPVASARLRARGFGSGRGGAAGLLPSPTRILRTVRQRTTDEAADEAQRPMPASARAAEPLSAEESRRRMLAARRRLLLMLIGLEAAAIALAVLGLAAVWVVVPPSIMLVGYLLLLREAAQADAERAQYEAEAAARAGERDRGADAQARRATPAEGTLHRGHRRAAAALAAKFAAAPVPADYEDSGPGRDFAPGLAGKYTTSNADAEAADEDYYDDLRDAPAARRRRLAGRPAPCRPVGGASRRQSLLR